MPSATGLFLSRGPAVALAAAALAFIGLAAAALGAAVPAADLTIRQAIHTLASDPLTAAMKVVTVLGGGWFLWPLGAVVVVSLARVGRRREAGAFAAVVLGANLTTEAIKLVFRRPRPEAFFGYESPITYSFPSGHSMVSLCFYLALVEVLLPPGKRTAARAGAVALSLAVGFSRVYLGVHYPSDVLAGWAGAVAFLGAVQLAIRRRNN